MHIFSLMLLQYHAARVTILGEFGRIWANLGEFGRIWANLSEFERIGVELEVCLLAGTLLNVAKRDWATFWASFSKTHQVTLHATTHFVSFSSLVQFPLVPG
jgi:hypothetical protein